MGGQRGRQAAGSLRRYGWRASPAACLALAGLAVVPHTEGVERSRLGRSSSTRDDHGALCRDRRVVERREHLRGGWERQDRPGRPGGERAGGSSGLVRQLGGAAGADRAGGGPVVAMALRGAYGGGAL